MRPLAPAPTDHAPRAGGIARQSRVPLLPWGLVLASAWLVGGVYLDGWAHNHGKVDDSFFTPWHAVLYSGYGATAGLLIAALAPRPGAGRWRWGLPAGYGLSLVGAGVFALAGLGDMLWHLAFGIEVDTAALLSPTHLGLALGVVLMVGGPLRATWQQADSHPRGWTGWLPVLTSVSGVYALLSFMTQFAHPLVWPEATSEAAAVSVGSDVYRMNEDGTGQTRLTRTPGIDAGQASWSPDGRRLAFTTRRAEDGTGTLSVASADGTNPTGLVSGRDRGVPAFPAWSPDGQQIAFVAARDGRPELYTIGADGSGESQLTTTGVILAPLAWSPDGGRLAFSADHDGAPWITLVGADGQGLVPLVEGMVPSWSPDGTRLAFSSERSGDGEIYSINRDGTDLRRLTTSANPSVHHAWSWWPAWSPDGRWIAFQSNRGGSVDIYVMDAAGGQPTNLTENPSLDSFQPAWSPDGRQLSFSARGHAIDPSVTQALGVAAILVQASLLVGIVLLVARRWRLPLGTFTGVFTLNALLVSFLNDGFALIPAAALAGVATDLLLWRLGPLASAPVRRLRGIAFAIPAIYFALYFLALSLADGMGWTIHLWAGSVVLAGVVGWLLTYLLAPPMTGWSFAAGSE